MNYPTLEIFAQQYLTEAGNTKTAQQLIQQTAAALPGSDLDLIEQDLSATVTDDGGDVYAFLESVIQEGDIHAAGGSLTTDAFVSFMAELSVCP